MCTPYLDDLNQRVLQLHDSIRSARLNLLDFVTIRNRLQQQVLESEDNERVRLELAACIADNEEHVEPNLYTINVFADLVERTDAEIDLIAEKSQKWNHKTSAAIKSEFEKSLQQLEPFRKYLRTEMQRLLHVAVDAGLPVEQIYSVFQRFGNVEDSKVLALEKQLDEFLQSESAQESVLEEIKRLLGN